MTGLTKFTAPRNGEFKRALSHSWLDLDYLLRRAEEEAIATIRSADDRVASRHSHLSSLYSAKALAILAWGAADLRTEAGGAGRAKCVSAASGPGRS